MRKLFVIVLMLFVINISVAQNNSDSIPEMPVVIETPWRLTAVGVPLLITGSILKSTESRISDSQLAPSAMRKARLDDYVRFGPGALMIGLKLSGVESRSSWGRMVVSDVFSAVTMVGLTEVIKRSTSVRRPDFSDSRSFPSGHAATAFMLAAILDKEYGSLSPWYSVAGYSIATYVAVSRIINNKHWTGDVLAGAGIGMVSAELGYCIADLIFRDRGLNFISEEKLLSPRKSYFGMDFGTNFGAKDYVTDDGNILNVNGGVMAGVSAGYYFNNLFGLSLSAKYNNFALSLNEIFQNEYLSCVSVRTGPEVSFSIANVLQIGAFANIGYIRYLNSNIGTIKLQIGGNGSFVFDCGTSVSIALADKLSMRLFLDYNIAGSPCRWSDNEFEYFSLGSSVAYNF